MSAGHVLIDGYFLGKPYGFGRFTDELCRALGQCRTDLTLTVAVPARVGELPAVPALRWHRLPDANFILWEQVTIPRLARRLGCDAIHFPANTRALLTRGARSITTVHDLMFLDERPKLRQLKAWVAAAYAKWVFRAATGRSDLLVSVSRATQAALAARGLSAVTVYNTIDGFLATPIPPRPPGRPYLLHRGGYQPHRNTARVLAAFRAARAGLPALDLPAFDLPAFDLPAFDLKVIGAPRGAEVWRTQDDPTIQFVPRVPDSELAALYAGAAGVVATSLREGFGYPIIEGFGFGVPVITSDREPMREIAGGAALLVDPEDTAAIAAAMRRVTQDAALAAALVERGRARLPAFSGAQVAARMLGLYAQACARPAPAAAALRAGL